jgi:DNA-binding transcriptional LysR family regulator
VTDAKRLLGDANDLAERARAVGKGEGGTLRVGVAESASSRGNMVNSLIRFRAAYPKVAVEIQHMTSLAQLEALTEGRIDVAFLYHFPEDRSDLMHLPVERTAVLLAMPSDHRLAHAKHIRLADLALEPTVWIRRAAAPLTYDKMMRAWLNAGVSPLIAQETTSESMSLGLVSVGGLLSFVTDTNRERCPGNVILRNVDDLNLEFTLELVWMKTDRSPIVKRFTETASTLT